MSEEPAPKRASSQSLRTLPWLRIVVEGVAIVTSILLAFGIDAWWDESQERAEERRVLIDLSAEFEVNRRLLQLAIEDHKRILANAERLLAVETRHDDSTTSGLSSAAALIFMTHDTFHPKSGELDGLLASGKLDLISDVRLRALLAEWPRTVAEFTEEEKSIEEWMRKGMEVAAPHLPLRDYVSALPDVPDSNLRAAFVDLPVPNDLARDFLQSREGQSHIAIRALYERIAIRDARELMVVIDEILDILQT